MLHAYPLACHMDTNEQRFGRDSCHTAKPVVAIRSSIHARIVTLPTAREGPLGHRAPRIVAYDSSIPALVLPACAICLHDSS